MLISPPFLPPRLDNETEETWLNRAFTEVVGEGMYPVGSSLCWHGGIHLNAPANALAAGQFLSVRAIADGTAVFVRRGEATRSDDPNHALNYDGGWTSDGVVVIEHSTEIGADAQNNSVAVRFYSVYMHLMNVPTTIQQGRPIYRKDSLGEAGYIRGEPNRIHFEIACDAANLQNLIGRATGDLPITRDGRASVVFGELYFHLPSGTPIYDRKPLDNNPVAHIQPPKPSTHAPIPPLQALTPIATTAMPCIVGMRYACGEGAAVNRGDLTVNTYLESGALCGTALQEAEYEYNLYTRAKAISEAYPANGRPAPSAVLELLRFGRIINTANETLTPNNVPHWREIIIPTADGVGNQHGWVNLNNQALEQVVRKFSDADFPQWAGWRVFDDDLTEGDSRCDSAAFKTLMDIDRNGNVIPDERRARMQDPAVMKAASHAICAMPSEWNAADIDARWHWLKTISEENPQPLSEDDCAGFSAHVRALCVASPALHAATFRFHPRKFIEVFRASGWMSLNEVSQLLPRRHGQDPNRMGLISWNNARERLVDYAVHLNKTFRKYLIVSPSRQTHFLAQTFIETAMWSTMEELGRAHQQRRRDGTLYWPAPAMEFYQAFYGRGIMQLTWAGNYEGYGVFRAFANVPTTHTYNETRITHTSNHYWADPRDRNGVVIGQPRRWAERYDPNRIAVEAFEACDSGAYYWISKNSGRERLSINRVSDGGLNSAAIGRASVLVNGGGYGYVERQAYAKFIDRQRGDSTETSATLTFQVTRGATNLNVYVDFTPQRPR
jgi:hypothetical protein